MARISDEQLDALSKPRFTKPSKHPVVVEEEAKIGGPFPQMLGHRFLLKMLDTINRKTPGGILIPDTVKEKLTRRGVVVARGPGQLVEGRDGTGPTDYVSAAAQIGDTVFIGYWGGHEFNINGHEYISISGEDLQAYYPA